VDLTKYKTERIAPMLFVMVPHRKEYDVLGREIGNSSWALLYNEENLKFKGKINDDGPQDHEAFFFGVQTKLVEWILTLQEESNQKKFKYILHALLYEILLQTSFLSTPPQVKEE
jgi:hypothetical protein